MDVVNGWPVDDPVKYTVIKVCLLAWLLGRILVLVIVVVITVSIDV